MRSEVGMERLTQRLLGASGFGTIPVRFEPALSQAIDFALGLGLVTRSSGDRIQLTGAGLKLASQLLKESAVFVKEKNFLSEWRHILTEQQIKDVVFKSRR